MMDGVPARVSRTRWKRDKTSRPRQGTIAFIDCTNFHDCIAFEGNAPIVRGAWPPCLSRSSRVGKQQGHTRCRTVWRRRCHLRAVLHTPQTIDRKKRDQSTRDEREHYYEVRIRPGFKELPSQCKPPLEKIRGFFFSWLTPGCSMKQKP